MPTPPLLAGLVRSLALLAAAALTLAVGAPLVLPLLAGSDLASVAALVGGCGAVAWAAARAAEARWLSPAGAFGAGLALPAAIPALLPRRRRAANDNDYLFSGSLPQFISE